MNAPMSESIVLMPACGPLRPGASPITASIALIPFVTKRVPSSDRTFSASRRDQTAPCGFATSGISLPIEYRITLGWLTSLRTIASTSRSHHSGKSSAASKSVLLSVHMSVSSSMTRTP